MDKDIASRESCFMNKIVALLFGKEKEYIKKRKHLFNKIKFS